MNTKYFLHILTIYLEYSTIHETSDLLRRPVEKNGYMKNHNESHVLRIELYIAYQNHSSRLAIEMYYRLP